MSDKAENFCLAMVLIILAGALGTWGIYKYQHRDSGEQSESNYYELSGYSEQSESYYYKLTGFCESYPDVFFEIEFEEQLTPEQKTEICAKVEEKMFENIEDDNHYIHYMDTDNTETTDSTLMLYIDFGCNDGEGLEVLLEFLDENIEGIKEIAIT